MSKVLIVYHSRTGATEQMASAVADGARQAGASVTCHSVSDFTAGELLEFDALILGSPTYYGGPAAEMKQVIDESVKFHGRLAGKVGGAFACAGNIGGGAETTVRALIDALLIHGAIVEGSHKGGHYGPVAVGKPDERALSECRELGARVARLAERLAK
ncbi:MAG TPA: NAD(P)H-dependent oxidoreductase [Candidatus Brocadiia bacterium]|nr:NAD(P)H-dependent oxidoreductase [Candidatus Brocadiia bacterium]